MANRNSTQLYAIAQNRNEARALRVYEIATVFTTLQEHIHALVTRPGATPPNQASRTLEGYVLLAQCTAQARQVLAQQYNPRTFNIQPGNVPEGEEQRVALQRIIVDISARRFKAHKIYLRAGAGIRWVMNRNQALQTPASQTARLQAADQQLRRELAEFTDQYVFNDLRNADRRNEFWVDEDPSLERVLAMVRAQQ